MQHKKGKDRRQMFFTSLEDMVPADSFARVIDLVVYALPLEALGFKDAELNKEGNEPYRPGDILRLMIYGQRHGIRSANKFSYGCGGNTEMMWVEGRTAFIGNPVLT
jgi:transposase